MGSTVSVRGTREGLLIVLGEAEVDEWVADLDALLANRENFFRGGEVTLQFDGHHLKAGHLAQVLKVLDRYEIAIRGIRGQLEAITPEADSAVEIPASKASDEKSTGSDSNMGILIRRTLRSGQSVRYPGHVVIIGDVNPGAEVIAEGDIVVWGHLRGIVHAGAAGDEGRCICALVFSPTQLRIGSRIARPPDQRRARKKFGPERAYISGDQIVVEAY